MNNHDHEISALLRELEQMRDSGNDKKQEYMDKLLKLRELNNKRLENLGIKFGGVAK